MPDVRQLGFARAAIGALFFVLAAKYVATTASAAATALREG